LTQKEIEEEDLPSPERIPFHHSSKSEAGGGNFKFEDIAIAEDKNKSQNILDSPENIEGEEVSPGKRGIFRRFMGLFRGKRNEEEENSSSMFKLEKINAKAGDSGELSPRVMKSFNNEVGMSLCKNKLFICEKEEVDEIFEQNQVSFEEFWDRYEEIIEDSNLILRVRDQLYDWRTGAAIIMSELIFGKTIESKINDLQHKVESYAQKITKDDSAEETKPSGNEVAQEEIKLEKVKGFEDHSFKSLSKMKNKNKFKTTMSENPKDAIYLKKLDQEHIEAYDYSNSDWEVNDEDDISGPSINDIKDIEIPLERCMTTMEGKKKKLKKKKYK